MKHKCPTCKAVCWCPEYERSSGDECYHNCEGYKREMGRQLWPEVEPDEYFAYGDEQC